MTSDPREALRAAGDELRAIRTSLTNATTQLHSLVIAALKADISQKEVVELSGYTRERVRTLAREHGIGPAKRGRRPRAET